MGRSTTSCDNCRRWRLGCNAKSELDKPCYNCAHKGIQCSNATRVSARRDSVDSPSQTSTEFVAADQSGVAVHVDSSFDDTLTPASTETSFSLASRLVDSQQRFRLHDLLWNIYTTLLEPRIGLWIGAGGCPFVTSDMDTSISISRLMIKLDKTANFASFDEASEAAIDKAMVCAIFAYSVHWLDIVNDGPHNDAVQDNHFDDCERSLAGTLRHKATGQMYMLMSRPSYRSILALYLFANIPVAMRKPGENINNLCLEASLSHQHYLRARSQASLTKQDSLLHLLDMESCPDHDQSTGIVFGSTIQTSDEIAKMIDTAYWFSIVSDTSRALFLCRPSILLPGTTGETNVWTCVRRRTQLFQQHHALTRQQVLHMPYSDDQVIDLLQKAFAHMNLVWAAITRVQDVLVYQMSGMSLSEAVDTVRKESIYFEEVFAQALCMCQRDFAFLKRTTQMSYVLLQIHFQTGNLILSDTLPPNFVFIDENLRCFDLQLCACRSITTALSLAIETRLLETDDTRQLPLLLLDPYPELMTNAIIRTGSSLFKLYEAQRVSAESVLKMYFVVLSALRILTRISQTARDAVPLLESKLQTSGVKKACDDNTDALDRLIVILATRTDHELSEEAALQDLDLNAVDFG